MVLCYVDISFESLSVTKAWLEKIKQNLTVVRLLSGIGIRKAFIRNMLKF